MSLRTKLLLLRLLSLILPFAGWQYAQQMETTLREGQEQALPSDSSIEPPSLDSRAPYFTAYLRQQLLERYGPAKAFFGGLERMYRAHRVVGKLAFLLLLGHVVLILASRASISNDAALDLLGPAAGARFSCSWWSLESSLSCLSHSGYPTP